MAVDSHGNAYVTGTPLKSMPLLTKLTRSGVIEWAASPALGAPIDNSLWDSPGTELQIDSALSLVTATVEGDSGGFGVAVDAWDEVRVAGTARSNVDLTTPMPGQMLMQDVAILLNFNAQGGEVWRNYVYADSSAGGFVELCAGRRSASMLRATHSSPAK